MKARDLNRGDVVYVYMVIRNSLLDSCFIFKSIEVHDILILKLISLDEHCNLEVQMNMTF